MRHLSNTPRGRHVPARGSDSAPTIEARSTRLHVAWAIALALAATSLASGDLAPLAPASEVAPLEGLDLLPPFATRTGVATNGAGTWVAAWSGRSDPLGVPDVYAARSTDAGVTWSTPIDLFAPASAQQDSPSIATDGAGTWIVVWSGRGVGAAASMVDIYFARSVDDGLTWSPATILRSPANGPTDQSPSIAFMGTGAWLVAWESRNSLGGTIGSDRDILSSRSDDNGVTWQEFVPVNSTASADGTNEDYTPALSSDGAGAVVTTWWTTATPSGGAGGGYTVLSAKSDDFGATWSAPVLVSPPAAPNEFIGVRPSIAHVAGDGRPSGWVVAWWSNPGSSSESFDPMIAVANSADGVAWTPQAPLAFDVSGSLTSVALASAGSEVVAAWTGRRPTSPVTSFDPDILVARSGDLGATWPDLTVASIGASGDLGADCDAAIAFDGETAVAVWRRSGAVDSPQALVLAAAVGEPTCNDGADCDGDGVSDACAIRRGWVEDCDNDGVPDVCQLDASDLDGDGAPDSCAIAEGTIEDCNGDGASDARQLSGIYQHATAKSTFPVGGLPRMIILERHRVLPGLEAVEQVSFLGNDSLGSGVAVVLYSDPNGDGSPADAELLARVPIVGQVPGDDAIVMPIAPTKVGAAGDSFFVGFDIGSVAGSGLAVADGPQTVSGNAWYFFGSGLDAEHPGRSGALGLLEMALSQGCNWPIVAHAFVSLDADGDGVIDACAATPSDINGDGVVDGGDVGVLLAAWGQCPTLCPADLDGDGDVDGADLGILLGAWD